MYKLVLVNDLPVVHVKTGFVNVLLKTVVVENGMVSDQIAVVKVTV